jgi:uncharacterized protein YbbC (DUF1343 family)
MSVPLNFTPMVRYHKLVFFAVLLGVLLVQSCVAESENPPGTVKTGADQTALYFPLLKGKAVGLVANHTSVIGRVHLADTLMHSGINLVKIYAPEHGFRGDVDAGADISNGADSKTGIPIISLYGSKSKPTADDLKGIGIMVYDIQDVGVRFYTYISTLHYVMEACAENNIPLIILDRPDPLGYYVDGPLLDPAYRSFVGLHPIPVVYGMTSGELARMINGEGWLAGGLKCNLKVIPCSNYDHGTYYNLPVDPSPNLNSMEAIYLYPSLCFFEGTIMSLGRGTTFPFRVVGHPDYPDKTFSFVPVATNANKNPVYMGKTCYGTDFRAMSIADLRRMHGLNLGWLIAAYKTMGQGAAFFTDYIDKLAGTDTLRKQIIAGWSEEKIRQSWQEGLIRFKVIRKKYLLYSDFDADNKTGTISN